MATTAKEKDCEVGADGYASDGLTHVVILVIPNVPETASRTVAHRSCSPQKKTTTDDEHDDHAIEIHFDDDDDADADGYGTISAAAGGGRHSPRRRLRAEEPTPHQGIRRS